MPLSVSQMRDALRLATGEDIADLPDNDADIYLNRAFWEIMDKFPFREKEYLVTFPTIIGERRYNVPPPYESVQQVTIVDDFGEHHPLEQIDVQEYENGYTEGEEFYGFPIEYTRENCFIRLKPTPGQIWEIVLRKLITLTDLSNNNPTTSIPQAWHEVIIIGGTWRRFHDLGDVARATLEHNLQRSLVSSMTPVEDKEMNLDIQHARVVYVGRVY